MAKVLNIAEVGAACAVDPHTIVLELGANCEEEIDTSNITLLTNMFFRDGCPVEATITGETKLTLGRYDTLLFAKKAAHFQRRDEIIFLLPEERARFLNSANDPLFLAADFNNWFEATKSQNFALKLATIGGQNFFTLSLHLASLPSKGEFKFVSRSGIWFDPEADAPNKKYSPMNSANYYFDGTKTGAHLIFLAPETPMILANDFFLKIDEQTRPIDPLPWLLSCYSGSELGAKIERNKTKFRIFIPRACEARVLIYKNSEDKPEAIPMKRERDNTWFAEVERVLHGQFYHYQALFRGETNWEAAPKIVDPYAKATCSRRGPGVILNDRTFLPLRDNFVAHPMKDDVILEAHVRDLLKNAPIRLRPEQRLLFNGLSKWLGKKHCYLRELGINTVEFQPITETDASDKSEYHWGYMPVNFFSPASAYCSFPAKAPAEFKGLVRACHRAGLAVILDVVYNHIGEQDNLQNIDPDYFFRKNEDGSLQNFSGCGNDLRTESPMVQRLIIDSLVHFIKTYNVDGFRFDLAELLGEEFLYKLERELKLAKEGIQIIYEPWSFRKSLGHRIGHFSGSAWNDEYRDFLANYVRGNGNFDGMKYFLNGSLSYRSAFTHQSVNYVESHDDMCWIDKITENWHHNGSNCTDNDRKRSHLALAILMMSFGIPMLHAGQDMLQSKRGMGNTYQLGGINTLDYGLLVKNYNTHKFFEQWIKFRLSRHGIVLRPPFTPSGTYIRFFQSPSTSALGALYNADFSMPSKRIFFAINPHVNGCSINLEDFNLGTFRQLSNENKFFHLPQKLSGKAVGQSLPLLPLNLMLCIE